MGSFEMKIDQFIIRYITSQLKELREYDENPHAVQMSFHGYIAALMHVDAITLSEYMRLIGLAKNAASYCRRELSK